MSALDRIATAFRRLRARVRRDRLDDELTEEIELHLAMRRQALIEAGLPPAEAEAAAKRQFGNTVRIREETRALWGFSALDTTLQDLRYALRLLTRAPWFTGVAVLSLAAGLGSAATMFTVADAVLWRPLPVASPGELHEFAATISLGAGQKQLGGVDPPTLRELRRTFDAGRLAGFQLADEVAVAAGTDGTAHRVRAECVTGDYFAVIGVRAEAGRLLDEHDAGTAPVPVVLSERFWIDALRRDPAAVNRVLTINGIPAVVIGVASDYRGVVSDRPADVFVPLAAARVIDPRLPTQPIRLLARLVSITSPRVAEQKLAAIITGTGSSMMRAGELRVRLTPASGGVADAREPLTRPLTVGFLLAGILLLVSCANTGGLLVARFAARQGEFGLRAALGASRVRLIRQLGIEAALLAAIAGAAAVCLARVAAPLLLRAFPAGAEPPAFELRFGLRLILFTAAAAGCAALIAGGVSLFRALRAGPSGILNATHRTVVSGPPRLTRALVALQIAASLLLVVGATSMTRTLVNLRAVDPGFEAAGAFAIRVDASGLARDPATMTPWFRELSERLSAVPSAAVTLAQFGFMTGAATTGTVDVPGFTPSADADRWTRLFWVGAGFFETLRIPLLAGRSIDRHDLARKERVAVVNQQFARFYFGSAEHAVGRIINGDVRIVGVAADAHYDTLRDAPARVLFTPFTQSPPRPAMTFIVRPSGDPEGVLRALLAEVRAHDPRASVRVSNLSDHLRTTLARERFLAVVALVLSGLGVFLACAGLYAAVSYATAARGGELAVRVALGATPRNIVGLVVREPVWVALAGIGIGLPGAYGVMRAASSLLYGIEALDVPTLAAACVLLVAAAVLAALWPALRASRIDPLIALRAQ